MIFGGVAGPDAATGRRPDPPKRKEKFHSKSDCQSVPTRRKRRVGACVLGFFESMLRITEPFSEPPAWESFADAVARLGIGHSRLRQRVDDLIRLGFARIAGAGGSAALEFRADLTVETIEGQEVAESLAGFVAKPFPRPKRGRR
jgi:hypothetical protein